MRLLAGCAVRAHSGTREGDATRPARPSRTLQLATVPEPTVENRRLCPTRTNGAHPLIAHWITPDVCLGLQRKGFHKCFTCAYRGLAASAVLADAPTRIIEPRAEPKRARPRAR